MAMYKNGHFAESEMDNKESLDLRCATVISQLDDISNDPNVPVC